jgi:hypothetical protein
MRVWNENSSASPHFGCRWVWGSKINSLDTESGTSHKYVGTEILTAVTMKNLLGCKNPVRSSQETHYVSATEPSRLMLCKIYGFHGGD